MQLEMDKKILGEKIKKIRKLRSLTQAELAEAVSLNVKQISRIESGLNYPTYTSFAKLITVLDVDIRDFCTQTTIDCNDIRLQILKIINSASETERAVYLSVLKSLEENFKNLLK